MSGGSKLRGNLLIAQAGGPSSVLNATLWGVIEEAKKHSEIEGIIGAIGGAAGILEENFVNLKTQSKDFYDKLPYTPASVIGTSRRYVSPENYKKMIEILKKYNVKYLLFNGGNGSMGTCREIYQAVDDKELKVIGIPKTIDNDISETDHCPGYGSAARYMAVTTAEIGLDIAALPIHICVVEVMGRNAGWIAASTILARKKPEDAPHLVYVPERPFILEQFLEDAEELYKQLGGVVVVVSEGITDKKGKPVVPPLIFPGAKDPFYGDVGVYLARQIWEKLGIKARSEKPGLAARASSILQSPIDRQEAIQVGAAAVKAAVTGKTGYMIGLKRISNNPYKCDTTLIPLDKVANIEKKLPQLYINDRGNNINPNFVEYCKPLVGDLPKYAVLNKLKSFAYKE